MLHSRSWSQFDDLTIVSLDLNFFDFTLFGIHLSPCMYRVTFFSPLLLSFWPLFTRIFFLPPSLFCLSPIIFVVFTASYSFSLSYKRTSGYLWYWLNLISSVVLLFMKYLLFKIFFWPSSYLLWCFMLRISGLNYFFFKKKYDVLHCD